MSNLERNPTAVSLLFTFIATLALVSSPGCKRPKVYSIGIVNCNEGFGAVVDGFKAGMAGYGFVEKKNVVYLNDATIRCEEAGDVLKELVRKKVDLLFTCTVPVTVSAIKATEGTNIPIVFGPVLFPVEPGPAQSLIHHGRNLTGVIAGGSTPKALEWHSIILPRSRKILVPCKCSDVGSEQSLASLQEAAQKLNITLVVRKIDNAAELEAALRAIPRDVDALWLLNSNFLVSHIDLLVRAAIKHKLPLSSGTSQYKAGVMISYGQNLFKTGQQAGRLAHKILEGIPPGDIPIETTEFYLGINLKTARAIGVEIPLDVLRQADDVVR